MAIPANAQPPGIGPHPTFAQWVGPDGKLTSQAAQKLEQMRTYTVGSGRLIPCVATGKNAILLTPNDSSPLISGYVFGDVYPFWAAETSDDVVTVAVVTPTGTLDALNAYSALGVQLAAGDVVADGIYKALYVPFFNSDAGGFMVSLF